MRTRWWINENILIASDLYLVNLWPVITACVNTAYVSTLNNCRGSHMTDSGQKTNKQKQNNKQTKQTNKTNKQKHLHFLSLVSFQNMQKNGIYLVPGHLPGCFFFFFFFFFFVVIFLKCKILETSRFKNKPINFNVSYLCRYRFPMDILAKFQQRPRSRRCPSPCCP